MPFVSEAQRRACYAQMRRYNEKGLVSPWDCHKFAKGEKNSYKKSSYKKKLSQVPKRKSKKKSSSKKVFTGPRGGKYKIVRNKKVYV
jgi:hypothetical protein